ncbi:MAG: hypothetical protein D6769_02720 [Methanobacteriota archaeon]|nr:MAG: hypothetical protein D6769_02720 [Euryarchaeota archaeon]
MLKLRIYVLKSRLEELVSSLHSRGFLHITKTKEEGMPSALSPYYDSVSRYLNIFTPIAQELSIEPKAARELPTIRELLSLCEEKLSLVNKAKELLATINSLKEKEATLEEEAIISKKLVALGVDYKELPSSLEGAVIFGEPPKRAKAIVFREMLKTREATLILTKKGALQEFISKKEHIILPTSSPSFILANLEKDKKSISDDIGKAEKDLKQLKRELSDLPHLLYYLKVYEERGYTYSNIVQSKRFAVVEGWLPEKKKGAIDKLRDEFSSAIYVEVVDSGHGGEHDEAPVLIENAKPIKPFELGFSFSSLPRADELNAAFFYAFTFPFIYGMIIGDVGYSLIALIIAGILKNAFKSSKTIQQLSSIWQIAAIGGIVWGIAYDEWFGASHYFYIERLAEFGISFGIGAPLYIGFHRLTEFSLLLGITGIVGAIHLIFGNLLGAYEAYVHGHNKHTIAKLSWALAIASFVLAIASYLGVVDALMPSTLALFAGIAGIVYSEGIVGVVELPSLASHTASYFRIAAVGVAGVVLAELINESFFPSPDKGLILNIVMLIVFFALHSANAFVAAFESTIQGGRLHILEFASKFIKGGGKPYSPFTLHKEV